MSPEMSNALMADDRSDLTDPDIRQVVVDLDALPSSRKREAIAATAASAQPQPGMASRMPLILPAAPVAAPAPASAAGGPMAEDMPSALPSQEPGPTKLVSNPPPEPPPPSNPPSRFRSGPASAAAAEDRPERAHDAAAADIDIQHPFDQQLRGQFCEERLRLIPQPTERAATVLEQILKKPAAVSAIDFQSVVSSSSACGLRARSAPRLFLDQANSQQDRFRAALLTALLFRGSPSASSCKRNQLHRERAHLTLRPCRDGEPVLLLLRAADRDEFQRAFCLRVRQRIT